MDAEQTHYIIFGDLVVVVVVIVIVVVVVVIVVEIVVVVIVVVVVVVVVVIVVVPEYAPVPFVLAYPLLPYPSKDIGNRIDFFLGQTIVSVGRISRTR